METLIGIVITLINGLIKLLAKVVEALFFFLPDSPFKEVSTSPIIEFIGYMNYLLPITEIIAIMTLWTTAIGIYYLIQIALRWIKVID